MTWTKDKAWAGGAVATVLAFLTGLSTSIGDGVVSGSEWVTIAIATITSGAAAFGVVWKVPNRQVDGGGD